MNVEQQFSRVTDLWSPKVIAQVNDQYVKVARLLGEFTWHKHDNEDELFLVIRGRLRIQLEAGDVTLGPGDLHVVPRGTMHNPVAEEECWIVLVEPVSTLHTGGVSSPLTKSIAEQLAP
jgi:mannose-6-phosphate isomerase-like protein (cupin superfamily)